MKLTYSAISSRSFPNRHEISATDLSVAIGHLRKRFASAVQGVTGRTRDALYRFRHVSIGMGAKCVALGFARRLPATVRTSADDLLAALDVIPDDVAVEVAAGGEDHSSLGPLGQLVGELHVLVALVPVGQ